MIFAKQINFLQRCSLCMTLNLITLLLTSKTTNVNFVNGYGLKAISGTQFGWANSRRCTSNYISTVPFYSSSTTATEQPSVDDNKWKGDVVPGGTIRGCSIQQMDGMLTEWIMTINGIDADLGRFSEAIYKKVTTDAKRQPFQGFRPGTIPPHLESTYRAFTMDECARETVLEALTQNNIRPFESTRSEIVFSKFSIPPPKSNKKSKKSSSNKTKSKQPQANTELKTQKDDVDGLTASTSDWLQFDTMKEAIDAGWRPGKSFSFVAEKCKGQKVRGQSEVADSTPLGLTY